MVVKRCIRRSLNSSVECQLSISALSSAEPGRPIDWRTDDERDRLEEVTVEREPITDGNCGAA
jgi:hypothetical protein